VEGDKMSDKFKSKNTDTSKLLGIKKEDFLTYLNIAQQLKELSPYSFQGDGFFPNMNVGNYMDPLAHNYGMPPMSSMGAMPMGYAPTSITLNFGLVPGGLPGYMGSPKQGSGNYALPGLDKNLDSLLAGYDPKKTDGSVNDSYKNTVNAVLQYLSDSAKPKGGYDATSKGSKGSSAKGSYSSGKGK
jgi:hypothetical protein